MTEKPKSPAPEPATSAGAAHQSPQHPVRNQAGLWIDHRRAVIVRITDHTHDSIELTSDSDRDARHHGGEAATEARAKHPGISEDTQQRHFQGELEHFYERVITSLGDAEGIWIFGPGEAKGELRARLEKQGQGCRIVAVEAADKLSDHQIVAKVRAAILPAR